ncbi:MAG: hypothetical protein ACOCX4_07490, partial [Planctomycetota bacterium]
TGGGIDAGPVLRATADAESDRGATGHGAEHGDAYRSVVRDAALALVRDLKAARDAAVREGRPEEALRIAHRIEAVEAAVEALADPAAGERTADRVRLWNQHNGAARAFGSLRADVTLYRDGAPVWRRRGIALDWADDADRATEAPLPPLAFDRIRATITEFHDRGGGLAEIEVLRGERNLALGCAAQASGGFRKATYGWPGWVTDGNTSSERKGVGYFLLPFRETGWVEVDLTRREPTPNPATRRAALDAATHATTDAPQAPTTPR